MVRSGGRSMKRIAPNWLSRLSRAAMPAGKALCASATFVGAILGIASRFVGVLPHVLIPVAVVACVAPALGVLAWKSRSHHLPDVVVDSDNPDGLYVLRYCPLRTSKRPIRGRGRTTATSTSAMMSLNPGAGRRRSPSLASLTPAVVFPPHLVSSPSSPPL